MSSFSIKGLIDAIDKWFGKKIPESFIKLNWDSIISWRLIIMKSFYNLFTFFSIPPSHDYLCSSDNCGMFKLLRNDFPNQGLSLLFCTSCDKIVLFG